MQICLLQRRAVVDPEPHSFFGSRRGKIKKLQQKKARGIVNTSTVIFVLKCIQTNFLQLLVPFSQYFILFRPVRILTHMCASIKLAEIVKNC